MNRLALSNAAAGLLRALMRRAGPDSTRFLLKECRSVDWQSLTFIGERHELDFRLLGPDAGALFDRFNAGLGEAEFSIPGQILADIAVVSHSSLPDGSVELTLEALTVVE